MRGGRTDSVFFALADPTRREVIRCLSREGAATVTELATRLPVSRQAVAKHLAALGEAGLVSSQSEGRRRLYSLTPGPMAGAMSWMAEVGAEWDERLRALRAHLERPDPATEP